MHIIFIGFCIASQIDTHIIILIFIMLCTGAFGGYLNYLHNFDTVNENNDDRLWRKYIFLGVGSAFVVPVFLKMIASDLIKNDREYDNISYLVFAGFCLIAAIFSRRFINTIGEKILEAAKQAKKTSIENKHQIESTQQELTNTQERIEDVKLSVNLNNIPKIKFESNKFDATRELIELVDSYITRTSIPDYSDRLKLKADLGRKMAQIILIYDLPREELLYNHPKEGMYLALAYAVELRPDPSCLPLLYQLSKVSSQLYTKYVILIGYKTLANSGLISKEDAKDVADIVRQFRIKADKPLLRNIDDILNILRIINPEI